jgi:aspartyl aminopeptidase
MNISIESQQYAQNLLDFIDASPSPWHVVATMSRELQSQGFMGLAEDQDWSLQSGGKYYVMRGDASLIAFMIGRKSPHETGFQLVGAHTDSPGLRLKPKASFNTETMTCLAVEVYGSPILATFTDRDLSLAGRVCLSSDEAIETRLFSFEHPWVRLPNLAIHMNRSVNEEGLKLDKQLELPLLFAGFQSECMAHDYFLSFLADQLDCSPTAILSWDINVYDTQAGVLWGPAREFIADSQLDNLSSCYAGLTALLATKDPDQTCVGAFFDHEEIGSESHHGAMGSFLPDILERIACIMDLSSLGYKQALARSFLISLDAAHAYHPNYPNAYEPLHAVKVNAGPVIKSNANQRYATDSLSEARFMHLCSQANVPYQKYVHRTDLACGSTIGPMTAAKLGIPAVDVGCPIWAMHSIRESGGALDQVYLAEVLKGYFAADSLRRQGRRMDSP